MDELQRSLVVIKPDGVIRGLVGEIISRFERAGLKIIAMKMIWVDEDFAKEHYFDVEERHGEKVLRSLIGYITEGPVVAMCLEGVEAIEVIRKIAGNTYPREALPGTIRGDFCHISKEYANAKNKKVANVIHTSANEEEAEIELRLWFSIEDMHEYKTVHDEHVI